MALEKTQRPYEFLARWKEGKLIGAHVQFVTVISDDGVVISETPADVQPVDIGTGKGFPIADILSQLNVDSIAKMDSANAAKQAADDVAAQAEKEKTEAIAASGRIKEALNSAIKILQDAHALDTVKPVV